MKVAVIGATGAVGKEILSIIEERSFPVTELIAFASDRSEGKPVSFKGKSVFCQILKAGCFDGIDIAFFDASDEVSGQWVPEAVKAGCWVVDNSAQYRMDKKTLLGVPEINGKEIKTYVLKQKKAGKAGIVAGPNCSTVQLVMALQPIHKLFGLKRVVVSSYQSTSGAGSAAQSELREQTASWLLGQEKAPKIFPHPIAFNCIPQIGGFKPDGFTSEEHKIMAESRKILNLPKLAITATAVRVPTFRGHAETVAVECKKSVSIPRLKKVLSKEPGISLVDEPSQKRYPMNRVTTGDPVFVGRLRKDPSAPHGVLFWVVSDNLRKGAALNAIQIGELLLETLGKKA